ncbi:uncharacterized protein LOC110688995 isoform X2 [Chenopodium quinoa]|uniref:uncharacterized protein LOC110688995 isoform X2 n=1 Tax=Chenopodium quinoa TaxID=63459 RepID=UPI000B7787F2|nr:uncharacterized protein LOC110688995 isoform X2 [Chenopodium quinoa]
MAEIAVIPNHKFPGIIHINAQFSEKQGSRAFLPCHAVSIFKSQQPIRFKCQAVNQRPSTYTSRNSTDIPFYETPGATFDQYLEDKPRVFRAIFPDKKRCQQISEVRWELQGLDNVVEPDQFSLSVNGILYSDRRGVRSRLKGQLEMKISLILPPVLAVVPEDVLRGVSEAVLRGLVENMKDKVNSNLITDYSKFRREQQLNRV